MTPIIHVRTQMPYAIAVGLVSAAIYIPAALGFSIWILMGIATLILSILLRAIGRKRD